MDESLKHYIKGNKSEEDKYCIILQTASKNVELKNELEWLLPRFMGWGKGVM